ncbi:hypothetical protein HZQ94_14810 [Elizabethkingia anophelis]|nr:hypothetical protein [Elizabethkingia anophelis]MCT3682063.1 hypothetical protein [Elizabethkingia anophelis]
MILTGEARENFLKWLTANYPLGWIAMEMGGLRPSFQNTLIVEWLDSVGIVISVMVDMSFNHSIYYDYTLTVNSFTYFSNETYKSRQEATEAAIKKAVEIFNDKYKENEQ